MAERADRSWLWVVVAACFVVVAPVAAEMARRSTGETVTALTVVSIVATLLAFLIPQARQVLASRSTAGAEQRELEARVQTRVAMNDALDPILRLLGNVALEPDDIIRGQLRAQAIPLILKTAAEFIGPERSRACWFRLDAGPPAQLVPTDFAGRAGAPSTTFVEGTAAGDAAIDMVLDDQDRVCEDVLTDPPPGWDATREHDYRAFVSVSVIAGDTAYGMLTLDALDPASLSLEDKDLLRLMAGALAVALSVP